MTDQHGNEWHINDMRCNATLDMGPSCDKCGKCECATVMECAHEYDCAICIEAYSKNGCNSPCCVAHHKAQENVGCIGLSVAYVCLDGGETLCEECFEKAGIELREDES